MTTSQPAILDSGAQLLLRLARDDGPRRLHLGAVIAADEDRYTVEFEDEEMERPEPGREVLIFFQRDGCFTQQPARVCAAPDDTSIVTIELEVTGAPVAADSRQAPRVATVATDLMATMEGEELCPVLDISAAGFAVMSSEPHGLGDVLSAEIRHGDVTFRGSATVQSARELWEGRYRYGLYCLDDGEGATLKAGLSKLSDQIQP